MEMGERIRALRHLKGISQVDLGEALGVTFQQVQKYERGRNRLSINMFITVCKALGAHPMELIGSYFPDDPEHGSTDRLLEKLKEAEERIQQIRRIIG